MMSRNEQKSVSNHVESFTYSDGSNGLDDGIGCTFSSPLKVTLAVINTLIERLWFKSYIFLQ